MNYRYLWLLSPLILVAALLSQTIAYRPIKPDLIESNLSNKLLTNTQPGRATKSEPLIASFLAVGDIMLSRNVAAKIEQTNDPLLPFAQVGELLSSTDFNIANLESPYSGSDHYPKTGSLIFNAPPNTIQGLLKYNFKLLNLANNHALDQGLAGLTYTLDYLKQHELLTIGAGQTLDEAWQPVRWEINGISFGFIGASYASINDNGKTTNNHVARIGELERLRAAISQLKPTTDLVIVSMHAGTEYTHNPNVSQQTFARAAIDYGADLVIGHHPHWIQTIETYRDKYIFYSLGNFIFDQMWSQKTREGLTIKVTVTKTPSAPQPSTRIKEIELIPVVIENYSTPRLAEPDEARTILSAIGRQDLRLTPP